MIEGNFFIRSGDRPEKKRFTAFNMPLDVSKDIAFWQKIDEQIQHKAELLNSPPRSLVQKIRDIFKIKTKAEPKVEIQWQEKSYNLLFGAVNVINLILTKEKQGAPYSTLVFLDRSGRMAAYFLRCLWSELKQQGLIDMNASLPEIRFVNIGSDQNKKFSLSTSKELYRSNILKNPDFRKRSFRKMDSGPILVVDEFISTGTSTHRAMQLLNQELGVEADGISFLKNVPEWVNRDDQKGVEDVYIEHETFELLEKNNIDQVKKAQRVVRQIHLKVDQLNEVRLVAAAWSGDRVTFEQLVKNLEIDTYFEQHELDDFFAFMSQQSRDLDPTSIVYFLLSEGGFLAKKQDNRYSRKRSSLLRQLLAELAYLGAKQVTKV